MSEKKTIAIMGATGAQGSGLVRAILNDKQGAFHPRGITRNANSERAKELAKLGAELVVADIDDPKSLERAFAGVHGAFCVTFFWHHMSADKELIHAKALADAAKAARVHHVIWSTLEDTRRLVPLTDTRMPTLLGKYKVPHFDAKGEADDYFTKLDLPVTILRTSFYWENFIHFGMGPKAGPDGKLAITLPMGDKKLPGMAAEDIGKCALGIFKAGDKYIGKTLGIAGEHITGKQMAAAFSKVLGREVVYNAVSPEVYRGFGFPGADEMGNMFQYKADFEAEYCGARDLKEARALNPSLQTFDAWLAANKDRIPIG